MAKIFNAVHYTDGDKEEETELTRPGKVHIEFDNGDVFTGTYVKSKEGKSLVRSGYGIYIWKSGGKYEGNYENGRRSGQGIYSFPNGEVYEGEWRNNVKSGPGKYTYPNGDTFTGTWVSDKRNGLGTFYNAKEDTDINGEWKEGKLIAKTVTKAVKKKAPKVVEAVEPKKKELVDIPPPKEEPEVAPPPVEKIEPPVEVPPPAEEIPPPAENPPPPAENPPPPAENPPPPAQDKDIEELDKQEAAANDTPTEKPSEEGAEEKKEFQAMVIIIAGAPASGKGTQCARIVEKFGVVHISTGDLLRAVDVETELGKKVNAIMKEGGLVDNEIVLQLLKDRLQQKDCQENGVLLDGYPRTEEQAAKLDELGLAVNMVVLLDVPEEELVERATGRRLDPNTKKIYHLKYNPPPEGIELVHREDDTEERVRRRLKLFSEKIVGLENFYKDKIRRVDGNRKPEEVTQDVIELLEEVEKEVS